MARALSPGQKEVIDGATVSVGTSNILVVGPSGMQTYVAPSAAPATPVVLSADGKEYSVTLLPASDDNTSPSTVIVGSYTVSANGNPITLADGSVLSYGGGALVLDGTITLSVPPAQPIRSIFQIPHYPDAVIGSITLSVGGSAATIDGQVMSAGPSGVVIDGSSTIAWDAIPTSTAAAAFQTTSRPGVGDYIVGGLGGDVSVSTTAPRHDVSVSPSATSNSVAAPRFFVSLSCYGGLILAVLAILLSS
jgi:hypothetical protein